MRITKKNLSTFTPIDLNIRIESAADMSTINHLYTSDDKEELKCFIRKLFACIETDMISM
ncbi:MAG: hypothetical protein GY861_15545 [bacterium]|nr:hypothetical protein [bacterium]